MSRFDDKRYINQDGVTSYAYGHYQTQNKTFQVNFNLKINFTNKTDFNNCVDKMWSLWLIKKSDHQWLKSSGKSLSYCIIDVLFERRQRLGSMSIFFEV